MRIAICDNDINDAITLRDLCTAADKEALHSYTIFTSGTKLCEEFDHGGRPFDLVFLDIEMPEMNGIQAGKIIRKRDSDVIIVFTTAYSRFALEAYECQPLNFILKPCSQSKIAAVISKVEESRRLNTAYHVIKIKNKSIRLPVYDILYAESVKKHVVYHTQNEIYEAVGNLSDAYDVLRPLGFVQVHQGYIVNMDKIVDFDDRYIILENKEKVEMSARKKTATMRAYAEYLERYI